MLRIDNGNHSSYMVAPVSQCKTQTYINSHVIQAPTSQESVGIRCFKSFQAVQEVSIYTSRFISIVALTAGSQFPLRWTLETPGNSLVFSNHAFAFVMT
jgi:hypothetical protein